MKKIIPIIIGFVFIVSSLFFSANIVFSQSSPRLSPLNIWILTHSPAVNVQATVTRAAGGATIRLVSITLTACLTSVTGAATTQTVNLRDGASGAGTVLWSAFLAVGAGPDASCIEKNMVVGGSLNTAMTLEFAAAPGANNQETVTLSGINLPAPPP